MKYFRSVHSYNHFVNKVLRTRRFVLDTESSEFLDAVRHTARNRVFKIDSGSTLARAQRGCDWRGQLINGTDDEIDFPWPFCSDRMKPLLDRAIEGRANPKGIPVLYMSDSLDTAVGEVRPSIGSYVSVGVFRIIRDLKVVDCGDKPRNVVYFKDPGPKSRTEPVWWDINRAFANPVTRSDDRAEYAPTQIISEFIKNEGYDGIIYRSAFGTGKNYVLFDLDASKLDYCLVVEIKHVDVKFEKVPSASYSL